MFKVLLVDDNRTNRLLLRTLLEDYAEAEGKIEESFEISEAEDGAQAVEILRKEPFDLIFMDIMMPNMNGIEATKLIKRRNKNILIIAVSSVEDKKLQHKIMFNGAEDYLYKPINAFILTARLANYKLLIKSRKQTKVKCVETQFNLFHEEVFKRRTTFFIDNDSAMSEFWEYMLLEPENEWENITDVVRALFEVSKMLLNNDNIHEIIIEKNREKLFLTLVNSKAKIDAVHSIMQENQIEERFYYQDEKLSIEVKKSLKKIDYKINKIHEETKDVQYETIIIEDVRAQKKEAISALELAETVLDTYTIDKMEDFQENIDKIMFVLYDLEGEEPYIVLEKMPIIIEGLEAFSRIIDSIVFFDIVVRTFNNLRHLLFALNISQIEDDTKRATFIASLIHIMYDLEEWIKNIFINQTTDDVYYFDASFASSVLELENTLKASITSDSDEDDLEFF